ncbi:MAG: TerB family tellurite resistance protein [Proteobacteria bacterium]|jgi:DnaJ like chaperone protein|nr:TerB family tellurite resistance protein [Pseudomonadota bacterium]
MSIWGKILGGAAGFALGGPLGALIGAVAGHAVDRYRATQAEGEDAGDPTRSIAFTIGVIVLSAKMAKADGVVTRDEIDAFKQVFRVPANETANVSKVFNQARKDSAGYEPYAQQLAGMFRDNPVVLEELLSCLAFIAHADGRIHPAEERFLHEISGIFALDEAAFKRATSLNRKPDENDPYELIGVSRDASIDAIKAAYRKLVRENHPDRLIAQGVPEEFIEVANRKLATINGAYDVIQKERGFT